MISNKFIIVGGGINGLFAAVCLLKKGFAGEDIMIIEKSDKVGGLMNSDNIEPYGHFDIGTHIFSETGVKEIDEIFSGFMEKESWNIFDGSTKDLPGVFYCNNFHDSNQYVNIDNCKYSEYTLSHIIKNLDNISDPEYYGNLCEFYYSRFGAKWVDDFIVPFFYKKYGLHISELHPFMSYFWPLSRIITSKLSIDKLKEDSRLRRIVAFPEIRETPCEFISKTRTFYPKKRGIYVLIEKIFDYLINKNVRVYLRSEVKNIVIENNLIKQFTFQVDHNSFHIFNPVNVYWTLSPIALCSYFGISLQRLEKPKDLYTHIAHICLNKQLKLRNHYYYILNQNFKMYRITNYNSFCDDENHYCHTLEFVGTENLSSDDWTKLIIKECDAIYGNFNLNYSIINNYTLNKGFILLTNESFKASTKVIKEIKDLRLKNLMLLSVSETAPLFFYRDIIKNTYNHIIENENCTNI